MDNVSVDDAKREVRLSFSSNFYGKGAIEQAGKDFAESCDVAIDDERDGRIEVMLRPKAEGIGLEMLGDEFSNYVLGLIQNALF
jgi:hypothetical protein